jgi:translation initiation factor IF-3
MGPTPMPLNGPRFNEFITVPKVRVIDEAGENLGVMYTREAMEQAQSLGLDLVEVSPNADPPVAKFLDVGKFKYENQKKANLARKSQKTQEIKEIKMRPNIDDHDYDVKMRKIRAARHAGAAARPGGHSRDRQGRAVPPHGRPADADGAGAAIGASFYPLPI